MRVRAARRWGCWPPAWRRPEESGGSPGWPNQTIRVVVPYVAGGTTDLVGRMVAEALAERLPRPVVVENRGGASGMIGSEAVARAAPDGHMLLLCSSAHAVLPELYPNLTWDLVADFTPVVPVAATPYMLVVHPSLPVHSVAELVALAKAQPGKLNFASTGMGTAQHLAGEQLKRLAGIDLLHVPYRGSGAVKADLLTGDGEYLRLRRTSRSTYRHGRRGRGRGRGDQPSCMLDALEFADLEELEDPGRRSRPGLAGWARRGRCRGGGRPEHGGERLAEDAGRGAEAGQSRRPGAGRHAGGADHPHQQRADALGQHHPRSRHQAGIGKPAE